MDKEWKIIGVDPKPYKHKEGLYLVLSRSGEMLSYLKLVTE